MDLEILLLPILVLVVVIITTALFQYLWNETMPDVFGLNAITFGQAFRMLLISAMLFGVGTLIRINLSI